MANPPAKTTQQPSTAPSPLTAAEYRTTVTFDQAIVSTEVGLQFEAGSTEPALDQRRWMERRNAVVSRAVNAREPDRIFEAVAAMFTAMGTYSGTAEDAGYRVQECARMLSDMPPWAVEDACETWARGGYGVDHRAPTSAELHSKVRGIVEPFWQELQRNARILKALPQPLPERVDAARADAIVARFKAKMAEDRAEESAADAARRLEFDAWLERNDERLRERERAHKAAVEARKRSAEAMDDYEP